MPSSAASGTAPSTRQHHPPPVRQEELDLVYPMSDASDEGENDILESGSEGEDLPPGQVCVEGKKEKQEQPPPLYHQLIMQAAQTLEIEMPAEQGRWASCFDDEGVGQ